MPQFIPPKIKKALIKSFCLTKAYAQMSTQNKKNDIDSRTVHVHFLKEKNCFAINTHRLSRKWKSLQKKKHLTVCFRDETNAVQIIFKGSAKLLKKNELPQLQQKLWLSMRDEVREAYALNEKAVSLTTARPPALDLSKPTKEHGVILIQPSEFDFFFVRNPYRMSHREIWKLHDKRFRKTSVSPLYTNF